MLTRNEKGQFVKGAPSPNPGGRPKQVETIRDLARQHTEDAIGTLVSIAKNPKASDSARVQASNALLDRAWGKPAQYVESVNLKGSLYDFLDSLDDSESDVIDI